MRHDLFLILSGVFLCLSVNAVFPAFVSALTTLDRRRFEELLHRFKRDGVSAGGERRQAMRALPTSLPGRPGGRRVESLPSSLAVLAAVVIAVVAWDLTGEAGVGPAAFVDAMNYGAVCNGVADDSTALQKALDALPAAGGIVYVPPSPSGTRCTFSASLTLPDGAKILGAGKWATILRYTGPGAAFSPGGTNNRHAAFEDFTLQLTNPSAAGIDAARLISSTFRSIRIAWSGSNVGGTGIRVVITDPSWTSFFNVLEDVTFDGLQVGILMDSSVKQAANRWRIIAPTVLAPQAPNTINGIVLNKVLGIDIVSPYCDQIGGTCLKLGASTDRVTVVAGRLETAYGGAMFSIHPSANRTTILGYQIHDGRSGTKDLGTRAYLVGQWEEGIQWTGAVEGSTRSLYVFPQNPLASPGRITISDTSTRGKVKFSSPDPDANYVPIVIQCGAAGSVAAGSNRLWASDLETTGFTIHAEIAPGSGNSITVCWHRIR